LGGGYIATLEIPISILLLTWGCQLCQRTTFPYNRSFASVGPQGPAYFVTRRKIILNSREFSVSVAIVRPELDRNPPNFCRSLLPHDDHVPSSCWISSTWSCHAVAAVLWLWYSSNQHGSEQCIHRQPRETITTEIALPPHDIAAGFAATASANGHSSSPASTKVRFSSTTWTGSVRWWVTSRVFDAATTTSAPTSSAACLRPPTPRPRLPD
jgi:hypothetical protein